MARTQFIVLHAERHTRPRHSELSAMAARHGLAADGKGRISGGGVSITDLGFDTAEDYRPYRIDAPDAETLARLLLAELPHHETIGLLSDPGRYDVTADPFLTTDPALAEELAGAGFAVFRPDRIAPVDSLTDYLGGASDPYGAAEPQSVTEMFEGGAFATAEPRRVAPALLRPTARPFAVVFGRPALVAGRDAEGAALGLTELMDRVVALMGGTVYELDRTEDGIEGGTYRTDGLLMEFFERTGALEDLGHSGAVLAFTQTFDEIDAAATGPVVETVLDGVRRLAAEIGLCLADETAFDESAGWLRGFRRDADGGLEPVALYDDPEAALD